MLIDVIYINSLYTEDNFRKLKMMENSRICLILNSQDKNLSLIVYVTRQFTGDDFRKLKTNGKLEKNSLK